MTVTKRTRFEVLRRDNYTCRYCRSADSELTVDHVTPVALGGSDDPENLVAACRECNSGKAATSPDEHIVADVDRDAVRWADAMARAAKLLTAEADSEREYVSAFWKTWNRYAPNSAETTLHSFYVAGLPVDQLVEAADIALMKYGCDDRWRYFCGVAWRRVSRMQEIAAALVAEEGDG